MKNASMSISNDGILTIQVDLKTGIGESSTGKSFLVARSDGRMENITTPTGTYYIAMTVGKYKEERTKKEQEVPQEQRIDLGWSTTKSGKTGETTRKMIPVQTYTDGAPTRGKTQQLLQVNRVRG